LLHVAGDVDECPSGGHFEPEFFAVAFHGRLLIRDRDDELAAECGRNYIPSNSWLVR
jgi:hypothetical protein